MLLVEPKKIDLQEEEIFQYGDGCFLDNPVFGIGVAKGTELREEKLGQIIVSITKSLEQCQNMALAELWHC
jgi:hypothetical protein